jgi:hypothetical protein
MLSPRRAFCPVRVIKLMTLSFLAVLASIFEEVSVVITNKQAYK